MQIENNQKNQGIKLFSIIVATDNKGGIGKDNQIPFINKKDLQNFKRITTQSSSPDKKNAVIMGKNTWFSLPIKPLPNRLNIIISNSMKQDDATNPSLKNAMIFSSIEKACMYCSIMENNVDKVFVIGGEKIYTYCFTHLFPYIQNIYHTQFHQTFECDCFFKYHSSLQILNTFDVVKILETKEEDEYTYTVWNIH
jgi:dihydrofolate reductase